VLFRSKYLSDIASVLSILLSHRSYSSFNDIKKRIKSEHNTDFTGVSLENWIDRINDEFQANFIHNAEQKRFFDPYSRRYRGWYTHHTTTVSYKIKNNSQLKEFLKYINTNLDQIRSLSIIPEQFTKYLIPPPKHFLQKNKGPSLADLMKFPVQSEEFNFILNKIFNSGNESVLNSKKALNEELPFDLFISIASQYNKADWILKTLSGLYVYKTPKQFISIINSSLLEKIKSETNLELDYFLECAKILQKEEGDL
jgi:predicted transcriptional regulator YheO